MARLPLRLSAWERERLILPLQRLNGLDAVCRILGMTVQGGEWRTSLATPSITGLRCSECYPQCVLSEAILPFFACLYWCIDQHKCFSGIWLVPLKHLCWSMHQ